MDAKSKRIGMFKASVEMVNSKHFPDVLHSLRFVPLQVEFNFPEQRFEYVGISDLFDEIPEGAIIQEYFITFDISQHGFNVTCKKKVSV